MSTSAVRGAEVAMWQHVADYDGSGACAGRGEG